MENKNKITELEQKILKKQKTVLASILDPILAGVDEMQRSFASIFIDEKGKNRITKDMEKFESDYYKIL